MNVEKLESRFGVANAAHIMSLWRRSAAAFNKCIKQSGYKVYWQCEEVEVPFHKVEDATMMDLLSEGDHPTEGHDYLFLIIHAIIDRYNTFVRWLVEYESDLESLSDTAVHPKSIVRGSYGAVGVSAPVSLSQNELNILIQRAWNAETEAFDMEILNESLRYKLVLHVRRSMLMNPTKFLRQQFAFRDDVAQGAQNKETNNAITLCPEGFYFANLQDIQLYSSVSELLVDAASTGPNDIRRTLEDAFHSFDYERLRMLLEGVRNVVQLLFTSGNRSLLAMQNMICLTCKLTRDQLTVKKGLVLEQMGFPELGNSQAELLLSLDPPQLVEFVRFVGHQLASEAHVFSGLPLSLKEPLNFETIDSLDASFQRTGDKNGCSKTLQLLDDLVRDVLSFYEVHISREVSSWGQNFREFLLENNFCDASDPIFDLISPRLIVRNYVPFRCYLHQKRLSLMYQEVEESQFMKENHADTNLNISRGRCWLWDENEFNNKEERDAQQYPYRRTPELLWFARSLAKDPETEESMEVDSIEANNAVDMDKMEVDQETRLCSEVQPDEGGDCQAVSETAVRKIQIWWRHARLRNTELTFDHFVVNKIMRSPVGLDEEAEMVSNPPSKKTRRNSPQLDEDSCSLANEGLPTMEIHVPSQFSDREQKSSWTYDTLYQTEMNNHLIQLYGEADDERNLRRWLNDHRLPQSVGDKLVEVGARDIEDVALIMDQGKEYLKDIKPLDLIKLKKALEASKSPLESEQALPY